MKPTIRITVIDSEAPSLINTFWNYLEGAIERHEQKLTNFGFEIVKYGKFKIHYHKKIEVKCKTIIIVKDKLLYKVNLKGIAFEKSGWKEEVERRVFEKIKL